MKTKTNVSKQAGKTNAYSEMLGKALAVVYAYRDDDEVRGMSDAQILREYEDVRYAQGLAFARSHGTI